MPITIDRQEGVDDLFGDLYPALFIIPHKEFAFHQAAQLKRPPKEMFAASRLGVGVRDVDVAS